MSQVDPVTRSEIVDVYNAYAEGIDSKNWPLVRACFADEIYIDYGDTGADTGGEGAMRNAEDWLLALQSVIDGFDLTRHSLSNFRFCRTEQGVECRAYLVAEHIIFTDPGNKVATDAEVAIVVGEYTNVFAGADAGWKIVSSKLDTQYCRGNIALFAEAVERAAATPAAG
ncbi:nuclear transport factor 2 family protein [Seongchinamella unica]|uniref:Nuclear transport factor 2 family protein n=1 Tax=Seongchinamella unica TaxID=2547392 RepID=A0A4R5LTY4_9GAMM|nr:nuclear transport factor 2 family protein [Seongchinamella unica]TDG14846.1 nuclear transport factor 2 family protein [Seongchinamella unica]